MNLRLQILSSILSIIIDERKLSGLDRGVTPWFDNQISEIRLIAWPGPSEQDGHRCHRSSVYNRVQKQHTYFKGENHYEIVSVIQ
jgi:hypothetical protein